MRKPQNEHGYTMVETTLYISILIILGGVLAGYAHNAMLRYKTGRTTQQVIDLKKAVIQFTAADEDYSKLTIENMDKGNSLPLDMRTGNSSTAIHALDGSVDVGPASKAPLNDTGKNKNFMFFIKFDNLYRKGCVEILTQGQFYGDGSELDTLIVNGTEAWRYKYSFYDLSKYNDGTGSSVSEENKHTLEPESSSVADAPSIRLSISDAVHACSKKENNTIVWVFS